jgi:hypothetical protein
MTTSAPTFRFVCYGEWDGSDRCPRRDALAYEEATEADARARCAELNPGFLIRRVEVAAGPYYD